jgi:hypothetical protein
MSLPFLALDEIGSTKRVSQHGGFFELTHDDQGRKAIRVSRLWSKKVFDLGCPLGLAQIESHHEVALPSESAQQ